MIDLSRYDAYLIVDEAGITVADNAPGQIKKELQEINVAYFRMYGEDLIHIAK